MIHFYKAAEEFRLKNRSHVNVVNDVNVEKAPITRARVGEHACTGTIPVYMKTENVDNHYNVYKLTWEPVSIHQTTCRCGFNRRTKAYMNYEAHLVLNMRLLCLLKWEESTLKEFLFPVENAQFVKRLSRLQDKGLL